MKPPNRRRMRSTLGSRTNRRNGTKKGTFTRPNTRMKALLAGYAAGTLDANGREP